MAHYEGSYGKPVAGSTSSVEEMSDWAIGLTVFATMMLVLVGAFHFITGLAAIFDDTFYAVRPHFALSIDVTTWGWLHMLGGLVMIFAGIWLITGGLFARIIAIAAAVVSAVGSFYSIPYYPVWSILIIAL